MVHAVAPALRFIHTKMSLKELVLNHVIDTTFWNGPNPTWNQVYMVRIVSMVALGTLYAFLFKLLYFIADQLSYRLFPKYKVLNKMQRVDWTSRVVAMLFIVVNSYQATLLIGQNFDSRQTLRREVFSGFFDHCVCTETLPLFRAITPSYQWKAPALMTGTQPSGVSTLQ